jgi:hypothetical protein
MDARIDLVTQGGTYPARAALIIKKPSFLRLELLPPLGTPDFFLTVNSREMKILLPAKAEFYRGAPTGRNLSRFLPWQFDIEDIIAILAGTYPSLNDVIDYQSRTDDNILRIETKNSSGISQVIWISPEGRLIKLVRNDETGKELYNAEFGDYEQDNFPARKITVNMNNGDSLMVKYSDVKIQKGNDLSVFDLPVPEGFRTIILD